MFPEIEEFGIEGMMGIGKSSFVDDDEGLSFDELPLTEDSFFLMPINHPKAY